MRILIAEDDDKLRESLVSRLSRQGFLVDQAADGLDAASKGDIEDYDTVVLDLGLPQMDGLSVLRQWREGGRRFPVLVLTARDTWRDRVEALRMGADDHVGKPFASEEIVARVEALIRRHHGHASPVLRLGDVEIDASGRSVRLNGEEVPVTAFEYRTLHFLAMHAGEVMTQERILEHVHGDGLDAGSNVVEVVISRLRKKFGAAVIKTHRGHGYSCPDDG